MNDVTDVTKFLLTGSAFRSFLPPVIGNIAPPTPYQPARVPVPPFIPTSSYVPPIAIKVETNQVARPPMMCMFCAGLGHMMRMCPVCQEYLNTRKVVRGQFSRLCLPDGTEIPRIQGARCLKEAVDHMAASQPSTGASSSSTSAANHFSRDTPPHITAGILAVTFPETQAVIEIDPSAFAFMEAEDEEDEEEVPMVTAPEFQPYIAQAWASFQMDQVSKDKGKCVCFNGVHIPP